MTVAVSNRFDSVGSAGASTGGSGSVPFATVRSPLSSDIIGPNGPWKVGQEWVNSTSDLVFVLTSYASSAGQVTATWTPTGGSTSSVTSIAGTTSQIVASSATGAVTLSIAAPFVAPGSITAATFVSAANGDLTSTNGNLNLVTTGKKINIAVGTNASTGKSAGMTAGTITIPTTAVTANSLIFLTNAAPSGGIGFLSVGTITPSANFVINSTNAGDTSQVNWWIIN